MDSFDRIALTIMAGLLLALGVVVALGDRVGVPTSDRYPADQSEPPTTTPIRVTFAQEMKHQSVESRFGTDPPVEGSFQWIGRTLIFDSAAPLEAMRTYTVGIEAGAESLTGRKTTRPLRWSFTPRQPHVLYLAPANAPVRALWSIPGDGGTPVELFAVESGYGVYNYAASPDGTQIAMTILNEDAASDIWLIGADGSGARELIACAPGSCGSPAWSPDGLLLAYERQEVLPTGVSGISRIWLYDLQTGDTVPVFEDKQILGFSPVWSPDGTRLAFFDGNVQAIRVLKLGETDSALLPSQMGEVGSFSLDGNAMVYANVRTSGEQMYTMLWLARFGEEGAGQPLLDSSEEDQGPVWSPDGKWIVFERRYVDRRDGQGGQLALYNPQNGNIQMLTSDPNYTNSRFEWSPDSQQLLAQRFELGSTSSTSELWVYRLADGSFTQLLANAIRGKWLP